MNKRVLYRIASLLLAAAMALGVGGCGKNQQTVTPIGGSDTLALTETADAVTLENGKIRLVLNAVSGSIRELANKETGLYLTKDATESIPLRIATATQNIYKYIRFTYSVEEDRNERKELGLQWDFDSGVSVKATVSLEEGADQVAFRIKLLGNKQADSVISVEYPIIEGIDSLKEKQTDRFVSPFVTGYLFQNPVDIFNQDFYGITKQLGEYPSGWAYPMQFSAYFSEGLGGFYWQTTDGGDTVKSFTMTGDNGKLRMSIYHYLSDISDGDKEFDYDIVFANLTEGSWYAAADTYRDWALQQDWAVKTGKLRDRKDVDKTLYEDTTLTIFGFRVTDDWDDYADIYDVLKGVIDGKFLNIAIYKNNTYMDRIKQYSDLLNIFEFSSLRTIDSAETHCDYYSTAMMNGRGEKETFTIHYYECAAEKSWRDYALSRAKGFITNYGVDGFYYDVDIAADHPKLCYDTTHSHGTRVNVLSDFMEQIQDARKLSGADIPYTVGTEMITEQMLPYVNYYQARANGGLLGWMEHDRVRTVIESGNAVQIPLFDYIYHQYGIVRTDGYLSAEEDLGDGFYYVAAYTALNGGIPELNYEYYPEEKLPAAEDMDMAHLRFLNTLGQIRTGYGREFLVYGKMMPAPAVDGGSTVYDYSNLNYTQYSCLGMDQLSGQAELPNVVTTAWQNGKENAVFLCNTSGESVSVTFTLEAGRDFGVDAGVVTQYAQSGSAEICKIKDGTAKITVTIQPQQVIMLNF